jgi:hypothetical protein
MSSSSSEPLFNVTTTIDGTREVCDILDASKTVVRVASLLQRPRHDNITIRRVTADEQTQPTTERKTRFYRIRQIVDGKTTANIITDDIAKTVGSLASGAPDVLTCRRLTQTETDAWNEQQQRLSAVGVEMAAEKPPESKIFAVTFKRANKSTPNINTVARDLPDALQYLASIGVNLTQIVSIREIDAHATQQMRTVDTDRYTHGQSNSDYANTKAPDNTPNDNRAAGLQKTHDAIKDRRGVSRWLVKYAGRTHSFEVEEREDERLYPTKSLYVNNRPLLTLTEQLTDIADYYGLDLTPDQPITNS